MREEGKLREGGVRKKGKGKENPQQNAKVLFQWRVLGTISLEEDDNYISRNYRSVGIPRSR